MNDAAKPSLFVICPIGAADSPERARSDRVLKHLIEKAFPDFDVTRADRMTEPGRISDGIVKAIRDAALVIIDMTDHNPNVFYEMAIAHGLRKAFVQIIEDGQSIPFDLTDLRCIFYNTTDPDKLDADRQLIRKYGEKAMADPAGISTPVSSVLPFYLVPEPVPVNVPQIDLPDIDAWRELRLTNTPDFYIRKLRALGVTGESQIRDCMNALESPHVNENERHLLEAAIESIGHHEHWVFHPTLRPFVDEVRRRIRLAEFEVNEKQREDSGPTNT